MPELLKTERLTVATRDAQELRTVAERYAGEGRTGRWIGSRDALGAFGLAPGAEVTPEQLEEALRGRAGDDRVVRSPSSLMRRTEQGRARIAGLAHTGFTFEAPPEVAALWSGAGETDRARIEAVLLGTAHRALGELVTGNDVVARRESGGRRAAEPAAGFAATATVVETAAPSSEQDGTPSLAVHGVVVGLRRADGVLVAAVAPAMERESALLAAEQSGRTTLTRVLTEQGFALGAEEQARATESDRAVPVPAAAPEVAETAPASAAPEVAVPVSDERERADGDLPIADPLDRYRHVLGSDRSGRIEREAAQQHAALGDRSRDQAWLEGQVAEIGNPFEQIDGPEAFAAQRLERDLRIVERDGARLATFAADRERRAAGIADDGRHDRTRDHLAASAERYAADVGQLQERWRELKAAERDLGDKHPEAWMEVHGEQAAQWVALNRALNEHEHEHARGAEAERGAGREAPAVEAAQEVEVADAGMDL